MTPPRARTWGRIGWTPVVRVRGRGSGRVSMAGMACYKPGERSRLIYAIREYRGRKGEPKGFGWRDFRALIVRARVQLGGPIVLVWDNVRLHLTAGMREFIDANAEWLTVFQLPTYAPDLNPTEGVWSLVKRDIGNLAAADFGQITRRREAQTEDAAVPTGGHRRLPRQHRSGPGPVSVGATDSKLVEAQSRWSVTVAA
ncbi:transposase [Kitasatospora phosalacinea]|uniref:transposase n=1 Tax=Kitasatospora phosalacinea TaxID=2065 RepID=UPI0036495C21